MSRIGLVLALLFIPTLAVAEGGILYIDPANVVHSVGDVFDVQVLLDSGGVSVNAAEADIEFNPTAVSVVRVSTRDSLLTLWPTAPYYSNEEGVVRFSGLMEESFNGEGGLLLTITLKALRNMTTNARLAAGAILAADGQGSNIITGMKSGALTIRPQEIEETADLDAREPVVGDLPTLARPVFQPYDDALQTGEYIVLNGSAAPNAQVSVWVQKGTGQEVRTDVMSSEDGFFSFVSGQTVTEGVYRIRAAVKVTEGEWGLSSEHQRITVRSSGLVANALFSIAVVTELLPFFGVLILGGLGIGYLFHRHKVEKMRHGHH